MANKEMCGWCGAVSRDGVHPPTHCICYGCLVEMMVRVGNPISPLTPLPLDSVYDEPVWAGMWRDCGGEA